MQTLATRVRRVLKWTGIGVLALVALAVVLSLIGFAINAPVFMAQHPEWATHPGDARPFVWDPAARQLRILTLAPQSRDRRFAIAVAPGRE